jgi:hypothetical protein
MDRGCVACEAPFCIFHQEFMPTYQARLLRHNAALIGPGFLFGDLGTRVRTLRLLPG